MEEFEALGYAQKLEKSPRISGPGFESLLLPFKILGFDSGWRPTFRFYNRWLSLFGTLLCLGVMIMMDYRTALATYICILLLYILIK